MLYVTSSAKKELRNILNEEKEDENSLIRMARKFSVPQEFGFFLDKEKKEDQVIEDNEGESLLLIGEDIAPLLTGFVLDYKETGDGMRFTISPS